MATKSKNKDGRNDKESAFRLNERARLEAERAIVLTVLSLPGVELQIVRNYLSRNGYVLSSQDKSASEFSEKYGYKLSDSYFTAVEKDKNEAEQLYRRADEMRAENETEVTREIENRHGPKRGKPCKKGSEIREQNVDRMLEGVLDKFKEDDEENKS